MWCFVGKETAKFSVKFSKALEYLGRKVKRNLRAKLSSAEFWGKAPWLGAMLKSNTSSGTSALRTARVWAPSLALATWYKFRLRLDLGRPAPNKWLS